MFEKIKKGDTVGVIAPSSKIDKDDLEVINNSVLLMESTGLKVKFGKNAFKNTLGYGATPQEKAEDINEMFKDKEVKMIFCVSGGFNSNSVYEEVVKRFMHGDMQLGQDDDEYITVKEGIAEGILVGGNLSLTNEMVCGEYSIDFQDKILFIEEFCLETPPELAANYFYHMKQNGVFDKIKGIWVGNYDGSVALEKILLDVLEDKYNFPIIKSNNFGHTEKKTVIPVGGKARIDTSKERKIEIIERIVNV